MIDLGGSIVPCPLQWIPVSSELAGSRDNCHASQKWPDQPNPPQRHPSLPMSPPGPSHHKPSKTSLLGGHPISCPVSPLQQPWADPSGLGQPSEASAAHLSLSALQRVCGAAFPSAVRLPLGGGWGLCLEPLQCPHITWHTEWTPAWCRWGQRVLVALQGTAQEPERCLLSTKGPSWKRPFCWAQTGVSGPLFLDRSPSQC